MELSKYDNINLHILICNYIQQIYDKIIKDNSFNITTDDFINIVYETPWISEIRCSSVKPKIKIYKVVVINPGNTVCR